MRRLFGGLVPFLALFVIAGCRQAAPPTQAPANQAAATPPATPKTKVIAYINVTSGCQADTVNLINRLGMDHASKVDLEIVDFGSPEGEERWRNDGLDCLTILFDGSPVVSFPEASGAQKTVSFFMPAGFSWTHEDLTAAFDALEAGTLKPLTEEEARSQMEPRSITLKATARAAGQAAEVLLNDKLALTIQVGDQGKTPLQRAKAIAAALNQWGTKPVHPSELSIATAAGETVLMAGGTRLTTVTEADAKAAGVAKAQGLAIVWINKIKDPVSEAMPTAAPAAPAANTAP